MKRLVSSRGNKRFIRVKLLVSTLETNCSEVQNKVFQAVRTKCSKMRNKVFRYTEQSVSSSETLCILRCYETF